MVLTNTKSSSEQSTKTDMKQTNSLPAMKTYSTSKEAMKKRKQRVGLKVAYLDCEGDDERQKGAGQDVVAKNMAR